MDIGFSGDALLVAPTPPLVTLAPLLVTPAKAGVQGKGVLWIPAFAGMTRGPDGDRGMKGDDE